MLMVARSLAPLMNGNRWIYSTRPFPHVVAYDVFKPDVYAKLASAFEEALAATNGRPYLEAHGIHGCTIDRDIAEQFYPLVTREWHDLLSAILGIEATGHVAVGLHHHRIGSQNGFPHNDLNPGWFVGEPAEDEVTVDGSDIEYTSGALLTPTRRPAIETVRAAAMLYYICNPPWRRGDGGATGLYRSGSDDIADPVISLPPLNNSMLLFECTPHSFHGFMSNRRSVRNSIVMWLHQTKAQVSMTWGEDAVVPYGLLPSRSRSR
jgi:2OG-Fe(II) oxygenase superfamily